jgi:hypothetical protein
MPASKSGGASATATAGSAAGSEASAGAPAAASSGDSSKARAAAGGGVDEDVDLTPLPSALIRSIFSPAEAADGAGGGARAAAPSAQMLALGSKDGDDAVDLFAWLRAHSAPPAAAGAAAAAAGAAPPPAADGGVVAVETPAGVRFALPLARERSVDLLRTLRALMYEQLHPVRGVGRRARIVCVLRTPRFAPRPPRALRARPSPLAVPHSARAAASAV